ncbi:MULTISPECIES: hypothetical protein [Paenibacillus]|uniref:hypothetical protein n=1 Tax=Paenibacillus TaxID=44249 RepID=UPI0003F64E74|nr:MULTISPECIES: hypothetical protein [Paenibacillus]KGP77413.1 hypothetical protein P364_0133145 [Paenibacillus sp. MAEPY2]KGP79372.1 hypothetical protein P363_0131135 [Paenibacillus sp. MAEPY1]OZQ60181.1 hypothetical protein CA599_30820 [Paenibacillus taichungensis]
MESNNVKTIRTELLHYIDQNKLLIYHFAEKSGINSGTLSRIINGSKPMPIRTLDKLTSTMGLEEGAYYDLYVEELMHDPSTDWRRLRPFIARCAELNKLACVEQVVDLMLEKAYYISSLFDFAEMLHAEGNKSVALIIYKKVSEGERYQHAERLAICQYRIFKSTLNDDQDLNLERALIFEPFVTRLSETEQLDALKDLANLYLSLRRWDKAMSLGGEMGRIAKIQYEQNHNRKRQDRSEATPQKPLFGYILYSHLILGAIAEEKQEYEQALQHVARYENHDWIIESDAVAEQTKKQFLLWATANKTLYRLMSGETDLIDDYVESLATNESEILRALFKIVKAALRYDVNIDHILERFDETIQSQVVSQCKVGSYSSQIINDRFVIFLADIGEYFSKSLRPKVGILFILDSLAISAKIKNDACMVRCLCLFDEIRDSATEEHLHRYKAILREVQLNR